MTAILDPLSRERLGELLAAMQDVQVVIVGDAMLDRYLFGDSERISPEAPVPVISVDEERAVPGGAANVAANVVAAGARAMLVAARGDDDAAASLVEALGSLGIDAGGLLVVPGRPTTTKTRIVARGQQVVRIDREVTTALPDRFRDDLLAFAHRAIDQADVLIIEDYDKGVIDAAMAQAMVAAGRAAGIPVIVDPKERHCFE